MNELGMAWKFDVKVSEFSQGSSQNKIPLSQTIQQE